MSDTSDITKYLFLPYHRMGVSSFLYNKLNENEYGNEKRAALEVSVDLLAEKKDVPEPNNIDTSVITKQIQVYGPGDLEYFSKNAIKDTDPQKDVGDYEPNYFPSISFWDPDFPWRYTPFGINNEGRLMPWLTLVVLIAEDRNEYKKEFESVDVLETTKKSENKNIPFIKNVRVENLPDINECWRWTHVQLIGSKSEFAKKDSHVAPIISEDALKEILKTEPERVTSRILCTRRLIPGLLYNAFLVPTFKLSMVAAGVIEDNDTINLATPAWTNVDRAITLPYYYRWEFRTGQRGDFEDLVRRLKPIKLTDIGIRDLDCSRPGYGIQGTERIDEPLILSLEGALRSLDLSYAPWGADSTESSRKPEYLQIELEELLNSNSTILIKEVKFDTNLINNKIKKGIIRLYNNSVKIIFETDTKEECRIRYWIKSNEIKTLSDTSSENGTIHAFSLQNLIENNNYSFVIDVKKTNGTWNLLTQTMHFLFDPLNLIIPPLYGRWPYKADSVVAESDKISWIHELNLDPRHRAAAGLGAEVIRNNQEDLMASAWEQAGDLDFANHLIDDAKFGIAVSKNFHERFKALKDEDYIAHTHLLQSRILIGDKNKKIPLQAQIKKSNIPSAILSPYYNKIRRAKGPISKRLINNGYLHSKSIVQSFNRQSNSFTIASQPSNLQGEILFTDLFNQTLQNKDSSIIEGKKQDDSSILKVKSLKSNLSVYQKNQLLKNSINEFATVLIAENNKKNKESNNSNKKGLTHLNKVLPNLLTNDISLSDFFMGLQQKIEKEGLKLSESGETTILEKQLELYSHIFGFLTEEKSKASAPKLNIASYSSTLKKVLSPEITISRRLAQRLEGIAVNKDKITDKIMAAPEFNNPMYKSLEALSQDYIIPGIEKIKQNTVSALATNRRFIEAYMCGLSHEFAQELEWREYSTDKRGTYFKQFWEPVLNDDITKAVMENLRFPFDRELTKDENKQFETRLKQVFQDIKPIHEWGNSRLGSHPGEFNYLLSGNNSLIDSDEENLVICVRGDLLKKYPDTDIYMYKAPSDANETEEDKFFEDFNTAIQSNSGSEENKIFEPFFGAELSPDISLVGFNLKISEIQNSDKRFYLVIQQRMNRVRYGLDVSIPNGNTQDSWDNLSWEHFGLKDSFGQYLDGKYIENEIKLESDSSSWVNFDAGKIACITQQKPVRLVIGLNDMLPDDILSQ
ncbi:MAG: hypothetical protein P1P88_05445 [Bacteroidales bacterium]|nr:hypothetical protein [Bacteroidales bacterium]